jgi:hypothetical protein
MARTPLYLEIKDTFGNVVPTASITVRKRSDNSLAVLYQAETGGTTLGNPLAADSLGRASAYVDRGAYNISVTGTGITPYTVPFDGAAAADRSIDSTWQDNTLLTPAQFLALPPQSDGTCLLVQADAASGINWRFRFNASSASASKWEFVGGSELSSFVSAAYTPAAGAYSTSGGPSITLPFSGDYDAWIAARFNLNADPNQIVRPAMTLFVAGVASAANAQVYDAGNPQAIPTFGPMGDTTRLTGVAAGSVADLRYTNNNSAGLGSMNIRTLRIKPVRVTGP